MPTTLYILYYFVYYTNYLCNYSMLVNSCYYCYINVCYRLRCACCYCLNTYYTSSCSALTISISSLLLLLLLSFLLSSFFIFSSIFFLFFSLLSAPLHILYFSFSFLYTTYFFSCLFKYLSNTTYLYIAVLSMPSIYACTNYCSTSTCLFLAAYYSLFYTIITTLLCNLSYSV